MQENRPAPASGKPSSEASPIQYQDPIMLSLLMVIKNERGTILTPLPENAKRRGSSDAAKVLYPDWN